jgi:hypothetical protein
MPNKSVLDDWSDAEIAAFDAEIQRRRFKDYRGLVEWAAGRGLKISRGAAHNRGKMLKQRLEFVKASSLAMEQIADAVKDDSAKASSAVLALVQAEAFEMMLKMQEAEGEEDPAERMELLKSAALIAQRTTNSSVRLKQFQVEARARLDADLEALKKEGFDGATLDAVQKRVAVYLPDNGR